VTAARPDQAMVDQLERLTRGITGDIWADEIDTAAAADEETARLEADLELAGLDPLDVGTDGEDDAFDFAAEDDALAHQWDDDDCGEQGGDL
jgi:hypothetical protein